MKSNPMAYTTTDSFFRSIIGFLFPDYCIGCAQMICSQEKPLCINCRHQIPLTKDHIQENTPIEKIFYGRCMIQKAAAMLAFEKGNSTQHILHLLKYKNQEHIGYFLGDWYGEILLQSAHFKNIDLVIPVASTTKKIKKRGYNQVAGFAKSIAKKLNTTYCDSLVKKQEQKSMVFKTREDRVAVDNPFYIDTKTDINGMHLLIVDDLVTTGTTLENVINSIQKHYHCTFSIVTIAYTV